MKTYIGCSGYHYDDLKNIDELFVYFKNDQHANAPQNAQFLKSLFE